MLKAYRWRWFRAALIISFGLVSVALLSLGIRGGRPIAGLLSASGAWFYLGGLGNLLRDPGWLWAIILAAFDGQAEWLILRAAMVGAMFSAATIILLAKAISTSVPPDDAHATDRAQGG